MTDLPGPGEWREVSADQPQDPANLGSVTADPGLPPQPLAYGQPSPRPSFGIPGPQGLGYGVPGSSGLLPGNPPPTYRIWARIAGVGGVLFNLILGFPAALVALRYARQVVPLWESGNQPAAASASRKARTWSIVSTVLDGLGVILLIAIVAGSTASNFSDPANVAASIKTQLEQRISDPSGQYYLPGVKVTSVTCKADGTDIDLCVIDLSNGQTLTQTATISSNGDSYQAR
jgi:hypothetical protein